MRRRPRRRPVLKRKREFKRKVGRIAKDVALRNQETKFRVNYSPSTPSTTEPLSNVVNSAGGMYWGTITQGIAQGTGEVASRIGNEITLKGSTIKLCVIPRVPGSGVNRFPVDTKFRFMVIRVNPLNAPTWLATGSTEPITTRIFTTGSSIIPGTWHVKKIWDTDNGIVQKVYVDKTINLRLGNQQQFDSGGSTVKAFNLPATFASMHIDWHNLKFQFVAEANSEFGSRFDLIWLAIPFNPEWTAGTVEAVQWQRSIKTWYKDA